MRQPPTRGVGKISLWLIPLQHGCKSNNFICPTGQKCAPAAGNVVMVSLVKSHDFDKRAQHKRKDAPRESRAHATRIEQEKCVFRRMGQMSTHAPAANIFPDACLFNVSTRSFVRSRSQNTLSGKSLMFFLQNKITRARHRKKDMEIETEQLSFCKY